MDQKNIGQVSGVNDRERQDFSGLNSLGVEQIPTGMTQEEAVARLNQMFEAQGMPGSNGFDANQMAMGQMAMQAQMNGVPELAQMNGVLNQTQMNSVSGQRQFEQVNPMQIRSEQIQGFENANSQIEQEKNLETERAEVEQGGEFSDEGVPKSDLGKIVTVGTLTFEDGKLIGTDLPKARDRDGLEEEILKEVEKIKKIKSPTMQYRQEKILSKKLLKDRYRRTPGQEN
jgi:hypothetical protein